MTERFDGDWLARREAFDGAARSNALAVRLAAVLPPRPVLLDLGAGTGSLFRWLAPLIGTDQSWILLDADQALLARALDRIAAWAAARGFAVVPVALNAVRLVAPSVEISIAMRQGDIAEPGRLPLGETDAVVCSALLDLVSARWIDAFVERLRVPLLACLSVDGRDTFLPRDGGDAVVQAGFRRDQGRDKGFGPALGPRADARLRRALVARGFDVTGVATDWRIPPHALDMLHDLVEGHARAALRQYPGRHHAIHGWRQTRLRQALRGTLAMRIGHRDTLALPQGRK